MKTLIAIPCMDQVAAPFAQSLAMLKKVGDCAIMMVVSSLVYDSRNKLVHSALEMEADRILWLDSDMVFQPNLLEVLSKAMEEEKADIVSGLFFRRTNPYTPVIYKEISVNEDGKTVHTEEFDKIPEGRFKIAGGGMAAVLMKTDFLVEMLFENETWFSPTLNAGEDISFYLRAKELGAKVICEPKAHVGHVGTLIVTRDLYESLKGDTQ